MAKCKDCGKNDVEKEGMLCDTCGTALAAEAGRAAWRAKQRQKANGQRSGFGRKKKK